MLKRRTKYMKPSSKKSIKAGSVNQLVQYFFFFEFVHNWYLCGKSSEQIHQWWRPVWDYFKKWHHLSKCIIYHFLMILLLRSKNMLNHWTTLVICFYCLSQNFSEQFQKYVATRERKVRYFHHGKPVSFSSVDIKRIIDEMNLRQFYSRINMSSIQV